MSKALDPSLDRVTIEQSQQAIQKLFSDDDPVDLVSGRQLRCHRFPEGYPQDKKDPLVRSRWTEGAKTWMLTTHRPI